MKSVQHPSNNNVLSPPLGVSVEECKALPCTRVRYDDGAMGWITYWEPTKSELTKLRQGKKVRLSLMGDIHPPVLIDVED